MGSRLGVLVKSENGWELYYDHWAAQSIGRDIAIDGVEATLERVRGMKALSVESPQEWEGAPWVEGTLLIDATTKTVVWAEESESLYLPRLINYIVEQTWPGWTAIWSAEGTRGTLRAAGVDPTPIYSGVDLDLNFYDQVKFFSPWEERGWVDPITVRLHSGKLVTWRTLGFIDDIIHLGPEAFHSLALEVAKRMPTEAEAWTEAIENEFPTRGVFVDFMSSSFSWWSLSDEGAHPEEFEHFWPGWTLDPRGDDYQWHQDLTGQQYRNWRTGVAECREWFSKALYEGHRPNPFLRTSEILTRLGEGVEPLENVLHFVPAERNSEPAQFDQYFEALKETPLPPARYISHHGVIKPPID